MLSGVISEPIDYLLAVTPTNSLVLSGGAAGRNNVDGGSGARAGDMGDPSSSKRRQHGPAVASRDHRRGHGGTGSMWHAQQRPLPRPRRAAAGSRVNAN